VVESSEAEIAATATASDLALMELDGGVVALKREGSHQQAEPSAAINNAEPAALSLRVTSDSTASLADGVAAGMARSNSESGAPLELPRPCTKRGKAYLAIMFSFADNWRAGQFRKTTGWPRRLRLHGRRRGRFWLWDDMLAANFAFCWFCHSTEQHILCDGICMRGVHPQCMTLEEHARYVADKKAPWFCQSCSLGRFPDPLPANEGELMQ
jgi:hypothetical protein